jgi:hypothetical protein
MRKGIRKEMGAGWFYIAKWRAGDLDICLTEEEASEGRDSANTRGTRAKLGRTILQHRKKCARARFPMATTQAAAMQRA